MAAPTSTCVTCRRSERWSSSTVSGWPPTPTTGEGVDISGIPFSAIENVQVLRDGASSLYGSDAIAGVVNFITNKDYQGGEVQVDVNHPQEAGGGSGDANFIFGHGDLASDGYNFMVTGSYSKQQELKAQQRPFSATGIDIPAKVSTIPTALAPGPDPSSTAPAMSGSRVIRPARAIRCS